MREKFPRSGEFYVEGSPFRVAHESNSDVFPKLNRASDIHVGGEIGVDCGHCDAVQKMVLLVPRVKRNDGDMNRRAIENPLAIGPRVEDISAIEYSLQHRPIVAASNTLSG